MTRDEWVTLPILKDIVSEPVPYRVRRDGVGAYWPETATTGAKVVWFMRRHSDLMFRVALPLAEFEALLFGPAEPDAIYKAAAVAYAEADAAWALAGAGDLEGLGRLSVIAREARDTFLRLYRERHDAQR